jgi:hypothetical protein
VKYGAPLAKVRPRVFKGGTQPLKKEGLKMTSEELSRIFTDAIEVNFPTVHRFVRSLREDDLIVTGRGRHGSSLGFLDAARLMLAFLITDRDVAAAKSVRIFGQLVENGSFLFNDHDHLQLTSKLLEDAVAELLSKLAETSEAKISITADVSELICWIKVNESTYRFLHADLIDHDIDEKPRDLAPFFAARSAFKRAKLRMTREFGSDVILKVAKAFHAQEGGKRHEHAHS